MSINTMQNKGLLWKLMQEHGHFNNLGTTHFNDIQNLFEATIENIMKTHPSYSLIDSNKMVIKTMISKIQEYQSPPKIKIEDIKEENKIVFDQSLENKQLEFDALIKAPTPKEINFNDNSDEPFGGEINSLLEKAISERENDLNVFDKPPEDNLEEKAIVITEEKKKVTFGDLTTLNSEPTLSLKILNNKLDLILANQKELKELIKK